MVDSKPNISQWLSNPSTLEEADEVWLKDQIEKYPWCFGNYALLAKLYTNHNSFLQPKLLNLASVYTTDRNQLYNFINDINVVEEKITREIEYPVDKKTEVFKEELKVKEETQNSKEVVNLEEPKSLETDSTVVPKDIDVFQDEDTVLKEEAERENAEESKEPFVLDGAPEEVVRHEAVEEPETESVDIPKQRESFKIDFDEIVQYDPLKELKPLEAKPEPKESIPFDKVVYNPEVELTKLIEEKEEAQESGKQDFTFWLNHLEDEEIEAQTETSADKVQDLLDKFLATKRKRPILNREFYNAEDKVEQSEEDKMDVISETLAELYVAQKHYQKAIQAYQKLSLQNPDKSATFAARIKELEILTE